MFDLPPDPPKLWLPPKPEIIRAGSDLVRPKEGVFFCPPPFIKAGGASFPAILGVSNGNRGASRGTSSSVNLPSGSVSNDRTFVAFCTDNNAAITVTAGWTGIGSEVTVSNLRYRAFYADGIGAGPVTVAHGNSRSNWVCIRLGGVNAAAPETTTTATGASTSPNPPSVTASWGAASNLVLAIGGFYTDPVDGFSFTASPPGYTTQVSEPGPTGQSGVIMRIATLETPLATEDPGAFTISSSKPWIADTIVIRPA